MIQLILIMIHKLFEELKKNVLMNQDMEHQIHGYYIQKIFGYIRLNLKNMKPTLYVNK